jgi:hypothetical protein
MVGTPPLLPRFIRELDVGVSGMAGSGGGWGEQLEVYGPGGDRLVIGTVTWL